MHFFDVWFRPSSRACKLTRYEGPSHYLIRLEERKCCVEHKDPKPYRFIFPTLLCHAKGG